LQGKVALISGSARGQGEAEARLFVDEGARVVVSDVNHDEGKALADELGEAAVYSHLDVTDREAWTRAVALAEQTFGRLDILVNNAGIGVAHHSMLNTTEADHRRLHSTHVDGTLFGIQAAAPLMQRNGGGSIVNISSIDGLAGIAGMGSYAASKFAVTGLTKSAALELGRLGIRVNSVHPGIISSPMVMAAPPDTMDRLNRYVSVQPIPRMGTPEEVAMLVLFLASDESSYITGAGIVIDGGHLAGPWREFDG
jgi:3alpha(or 20beta)-hydroxysteroid dehydrogenase